MQCKEVRDKLSRYADGEFGGRAAADIKHHLNECQACRSAAESLIALQSIVSDSLKERIPYPDLSGAVMSQLSAPKRSALKPTWAWAAAAAVLAAVAILAYQWPTTSPPQAPARVVHMPPIQRQLAAKQHNARRQESAAAQSIHRKAAPTIVPRMASPAHKHFQQREAAKTERRTASVDNHLRISIDVVSVASANSDSGLRVVTTVESGGLLLAQVHQQEITKQEEPLPNAETIERPPLEEGSGRSPSWPSSSGPVPNT